LKNQGVIIEGEKIKGIPMVIISDSTIKNEKVSMVNLDVYAGFGRNHLRVNYNIESSLTAIQKEL
jgi:hypothetical protein